jgi:alkylation response protein AidB-like acyl-CoA dehydrogenase
MFVGVELARAHCYYAAWALSSAAPELAVAACGARISATEAYEFCARENLQIHGGIGFTWEADPHLFYRRSKNLALSLGSVQRWRDQLVQRLTHSPVMRQAVGA